MFAMPTAAAHLKKQIPNDPELRAKLTPSYSIGCRRVRPLRIKEEPSMLGWTG